MRMRWASWIVAAAAVLAPAWAQTPAAELLKPPAAAQRYVIGSAGGVHGESWAWRTPEGALAGRESLNLRGQVWELDAVAGAGADGMPAKVTVRGVSPQGDAAETFAIEGGKARWKSPIDQGEAAYAAPAFYAAQGGPFVLNAWLLEQVLAQPDKSMALLPGGRVSAEKLTTLEVGEGAARKTVTAWALSGLGTAPLPIWADAQNRFFGASLGLFWLPQGYEGERARLDAAQSQALAARQPELAKRLAVTPPGPVAFVGVKLFDAEAKRFLADQTVIVTDGRITKVGPAKRVRAPKGAQVIEGAGKTLLPGLWDAHMHVGDDFTGLQELSLGVTSVRDPGNDNARTLDRRARAAKGELLGPNVYASSLIDGRGPYTAQVANVATTQEEAIALVRKAKEDGFIGVKFYGTFGPEWLKPSIAEAKRLGLHVHGHIPAGMKPMEALEAGYNEITHINWVVMQAMPMSVIKVSNGIARFEGPGRYAKTVDLDGPDVQGIIAAMAKAGIYSDPTMAVFENLYVAENGDLSPSYAPFVGTMPPATERGFRSGGFAVPKDLSRAHYRDSYATLKGLLARMHKAGVPIVAGTDGSGIEIVRELEIYVEAGLTPAEALATATLAPARLVGQEKQTGSIVKGKAADLVLVEGDPEARIGDLRQTRVVMLGGKLLDADALRAAAGFSGRPK